jgi:DNA-directed RNA polymerase specialized sigma24 family protein
VQTAQISLSPRVNPSAGIKGDAGPNRFTTTRWSLILAYASSDTTKDAARHALSELCQIYWRPIFAFIFRRGYSESDAQDLTQDFFLMIIEGNLLSIADPSRGRFRSLLLKSLQNFLNDDHDRRRAEKRGGGKQFIRWDDWMAESPSHSEASFRGLENWPPEKVFDLRWAVAITEQSLHRLARECENSGRQRMFSILSKYLMTDRSEISYVHLSVSLGVPPRSVKRLLHYLRGRYRSILREEVSQTVETAADVDDEIRYLCDVLASIGA